VTRCPIGRKATPPEEGAHSEQRGAGTCKARWDHPLGPSGPAGGPRRKRLGAPAAPRTAHAKTQGRGHARGRRHVGARRSTLDGVVGIRSGCRVSPCNPACKTCPPGALSHETRQTATGPLGRPRRRRRLRRSKPMQHQPEQFTRCTGARIRKEPRPEAEARTKANGGSMWQSLRRAVRGRQGCRSPTRGNKTLTNTCL